MIPPVDVYRLSNPFRSSNIRPGANEFIFAAGSIESSVEDVYQRLLTSHCCQIVGPHGTGKSTLLLAVIQCAETHGLSVASLVLDGRIQNGGKRITDCVSQAHQLLSKVDLLTIDGFEQFSWWQRGLVLRNAKQLGKRLLVTSHRDMGLEEIYRTNIDLDVAKQVVRSICVREHISLPPSGAELSELMKQHHGNLRETLFSLYDQYQLNSVA